MSTGIRICEVNQGSHISGGQVILDLQFNATDAKRHSLVADIMLYDSDLGGFLSACREGSDLGKEPTFEQT